MRIEEVTKRDEDCWIATKFSKGEDLIMHLAASGMIDLLKGKTDEEFIRCCVRSIIAGEGTDSIEYSESNETMGGIVLDGALSWFNTGK